MSTDDKRRLLLEKAVKENNNFAYNQAIRQLTEKYVNSKQLEEGMLNRAERRHTSI